MSECLPSMIFNSAELYFCQKLRFGGCFQFLSSPENSYFEPNHFYAQKSQIADHSVAQYLQVVQVIEDALTGLQQVSLHCLLPERMEKSGWV